MQVVVNGEAREVHEGLTLTALVAEMGLGERRVAIELNRDVVSRDAWDRTALGAGDVVEIVHFVGGG